MIRRATLADSIALAELAARTFRETYSDRIAAELLEPYIARQFSPEATEAALCDSATRFFVETSSNALLGYARLRHGSAPEGVHGRALELQCLYVAHEHHSHGIGTRLIEAASELARDEQCATLWLAVWSRNDHAIAFYQRRGFAEAGPIPFRMGDAVLEDRVMARAV